MMKLSFKKAEPFWSTLSENSCLSAACAGNQTCGKCRITLVQGTMPITDTEKRLLSKEEIKAGIRLACCHEKAEEDIAISINQETGFRILGSLQKQVFANKTQKGIGIAIDLGTTTVVMAYIDRKTGEVLWEDALVHPPRSFGADVITRLQSCNEHGVESLQSILLQRMKKSIQTFQSCFQKEISCMYVCGNPAMVHIFQGVDPRKISEYPYTCPITETQILTDNWFQLPMTVPITILPHFSAFVGGDILAGIISLSTRMKEHTMLLDLGTNGELVLCHHGKMYVTSTAAGPAFEGGNMKHGMAATDGAIYQIRYENGWCFNTIGNTKPIGICGSGYMEGIAELLRMKDMDETGYLKQTCQLSANVSIVQEDIRNFQLAKSAIRTGIESLLATCQLTASDIQHVYIAGGFGKALKIQTLITLGILPAAFLGRCSIIGNSALQGTIQIMQTNALSKAETLQKEGVCVELAQQEGFMDTYMEHMWFL